jgi:hypothetical protein
MDRYRVFAALVALAAFQGAASADSIVWSDFGTSIFTANTDGSGLRTVVADSSFGPIDGLDVDSVGQKVYFSSSQGGLQRVNLDGSGLETLIADSPMADNNIQAISLDLPRGHVYYTRFDSGAPGGRTSISRVDLDGSNQVTIADGLFNAQTLAIDSVNGRIYYADSTDFSGAFGTFFIRSIDLDGSNGQDIVTGLNWVNFLAVDPVVGSLYADNFYSPFRANLDGSNVQLLINPFGYSDLAIDPAGSLYGTAGVGISRADLDGGNATVIPGLESIRGGRIAFVGSQLAAVPEPSTLALAGFGMLGAAGLAWKRRARA